MKAFWCILLGMAISTTVATSARAALHTQAVKYSVGSTDCIGYLAYDDSAKNAPGILVAPEWWGLTDYTKHRAEQLAQLGYVAFVMDPYGNGQNTDDPAVAGKLSGALKNGDRTELRKRAAAALDVLKKDPHVNSAKLAAIGYCFGGTTALELARSGADLQGVVSFHGGLATPTPADAKNIKGKVLICHGADDSFESSAEIEAFKKEMNDAKVDWQMNIYAHAQHAFTNPQADSHHIPGIKYNAKADRRSWQAMRDFFDEIFK